MPIGKENTEFKTVREWESFLTSVIREFSDDDDLGYKILDPSGFIDNIPYSLNNNEDVFKKKMSLLSFLVCAGNSVVSCKARNTPLGMKSLIDKAIENLNKEN